ncbi:Uncharacterised protein [Chryseobacterium nakagawai]|uniref:Uncharacterized protein n=1 Tax=Chryseobacterium nakagawai TaxID=1241982 RepID=A0AAD0YGL6_CHRNA|nr:hypothetical protein [Chryseobacterium nakagawai]AZA89662.1 hypothetical protein EG343_02955 [Chryseobacterium nakagawai]VEH21043.1 Uncharacterised protein [Chryseobacterium nakagawai]
MEDNLTYEFFIRRCWNCDRFKHGANTDDWERLTINHFNYKNPKPGVKEDQLERTYHKKLDEIKEHLDKAFNKLSSVLAKKKIPASVIDDIAKYKTQVADSTQPQEIMDCLNSTIPILDEYDIRLK